MPPKHLPNAAGKQLFANNRGYVMSATYQSNVRWYPYTAGWAAAAEATNSEFCTASGDTDDHLLLPLQRIAGTSSSQTTACNIRVPR